MIRQSVIYSSSILFRDVPRPQRMPATADRAKLLSVYIFPYLYISLIKLNFKTRHSKRLITITGSGIKAI